MPEISFESIIDYLKRGIDRLKNVATQTANGLMSANDKKKLDGVETGANKYIHPSYTARTGKPTANLTPGFGDEITISQITSDATGHVTAATDRKITVPSSTASSSKNGLMSSGDKTKLDGIATGANNYTHPTYTARTGKPTENQSPAFGGSVTVSQITSDATGHITATTDRTITFPSSTASSSKDGLMSKDDKSKLDNIASGANAYTHPAYTARTGKPTENQSPAFGGSVTVSQITSDATGHVTAATDRTITFPSSTASSSKDGLMSKDDKSKLDNIASGANNYVHPSYTARTGKPAANLAPKSGGAVTISQVTSDNTGHVTAATDRTITMPPYITTGAASGTTVGSYATAEGYNNTATGNYSHAEGYMTAATGKCSHVEGQGIKEQNLGWLSGAFGDYSHAEGYGTASNNEASHAEGKETEASGIASHAEGLATFSTQEAAHAEGNGTTASASSSHAEGNATTASGMASHAEGIKTTASGLYSHAEGNNTSASKSCSHAEGNNTSACASNSHAEGNGTTASGVTSHAEGWNTLASDVYCHAEGWNTTASNTGSHAEGHNTIASNGNSHAEGEEATASGLRSHAEGYKTTASGEESHAEGRNTSALSFASHAEGSGSGVGIEGYYGHAEGYETASNGEGSHAEGYQTEANNRGSHAEGMLTKANGGASHAEGKETTASGPYSHVEGHYSEITTGGNCSHAEGYRTTVSSQASHAEGYGTSAVGDAAHAAGYFTIADQSQVAIGHYNKKMTGGGGGTGGNGFVIGNGTRKGEIEEEANFVRSNAFRITFAGAAYGLAAYNSSGADYAEYFEWMDGNEDDEDRIGYFVTLQGKNIAKASPGDYILGVTSGNPCIIGNADEDWLGRWERDEYGRYIKVRMELPKNVVELPETVTDEKEDDGQAADSKSAEKDKTDTRISEEKEYGWTYKANPEYDPSLEYVERKDRKEWSAVGIVGMLAVRDDGTCSVNGYAKVANGGTATAAPSHIPGETYRVVERVNENVVTIFIK